MTESCTIQRRINSVFALRKEKTVIEKYSEKYIREEKVELLKKKIRKEINSYFKECKLNLSFAFRENEDDEHIERDILEMSALIRLRHYINDCKTAFMQCEENSPDNDQIIYALPSDYIDVFLMDEFRFVSGYLTTVENYGYETSHIFKHGDVGLKSIITIIELGYLKRKLKGDK